LPEFIEIQGHRLEFELTRHAGADAPLLVFLHEGLGSLALWRDFPARCAQAAGANSLVYSRYGYGQSDPLKEPRRPDYMHREALETLPALLDQLAIERPILFGHSDGASIALIHAASHPARGVIALAPHVVVEDISIESIGAIRQVYRDTDLREKLAKYHADPDSAFWGWNNIWLDPAFRKWCIEDRLSDIECPVLAVQGFNDEYGTMDQVDRMARSVPNFTVLKLENCCHSPHRDQPDAVIAATVGFLGQLDTPNGKETGRSSDR